MRTLITLTLLLFLAALGIAADDEREKKVAEQKKAAEAAWKMLEAGEFVFVETKHLLIYAPKALEKQLQPKGDIMEKYHDSAIKATELNPKDGYPGKITVYLLPEDTWAAFARRVEKRRPMSGETAGYKADDDMLHAAVAPGGKVPVEVRAGEMVAVVLLQRKAGRATALPDWLTAGFGRATSYDVMPKEKFVLAERAQAKALAKKRDASVVWDGVPEADEIAALQGSVAYFLAYGPAKKYFAKTLTGFQPGENVAVKTTPQALESAGFKAETLAKAWKVWLK